MLFKIGSSLTIRTCGLLLSIGLAACSGQPSKSERDDAEELLEQMVSEQFLQESELSLVVQHKVQCAISGVLLSGTSQDKLIIGLGKRPTTGYEMAISRQQLIGGELQISYSETQPEWDDSKPQVISSPCMIIALPEVWNGLRVTEDTSGNSVYFRR